MTDRSWGQVFISFGTAPKKPPEYPAYRSVQKALLFALLPPLRKPVDGAWYHEIEEHEKKVLVNRV